MEEYVRILSGFYGILRPLDGVVPYRLEMQAKGNPGEREICMISGRMPFMGSCGRRRIVL